MDRNCNQHYVWSSQFKDIWEIASQLKENAAQVDVYLQGLENNNRSEITAIHHRRSGALPAHRVMLAAASPFLSKVLSEHYTEHHDTCVNVILPNVSHSTLHFIVDFIYCGRTDIPLSARKEVLEAADFLQIVSLVNYFEVKESVVIDENPLVTTVKEENDDATCEVRVPLKWRGRKKKLLHLSSETLGMHCNKAAKGNIENGASLEDGEYRAERSRRRIKSRYDSDIYEVSLPKMRGLEQDVSELLVIKKEKRKRRLKETFPSKKENIHSNALKSSLEDLSKVSNGGHGDEGSEDTGNFEKVIEFPPPNSKEALDFSDEEDPMRSEIGEVPLEQSFSRPISPNLFSADTSYLQESGEIPCTSFIESATSVTAIPKQHFSAPLTVASSSSSVISQMSELPVVSVPFPGGALKATSLKYVPEICKDVSHPEDENDVDDENDEDDQAELEDGLLKLQVLLKDCEDFPESVTPRSGNPLRCQNSDGTEVKLEEPTAEVDISRWISEEMKSSLITEETIDNKVNCKDGEKCTPQRDEAVGNANDKNPASASDSNDNDKKAAHKCCICGKTYSDAQSYKQHLKNFHREAKQMCKHCGKMFKRRCDLYDHERRHDDANLPCKICSKTFKLKKDLAAHLRTHNGGKRYSCPECNKELSSFRNLRNHIAGVHQKKRSYACHMCNKTYAKSCALQVHIRSVHTGERPFKCKICGKTFCNPCLLKSHEVSHTGEQKYSCKVCQRRFSQYCNMITHQRVHSNERPFVCLICKEGYKTRESLRKHKWIHTGLKPLRCPHCSKEYRIKESFERHMLKCHDEVVHLPQIYFEMSEKVALGNIQSDAHDIGRKTVRHTNISVGEDQSHMKHTDNMGKKVQVQGTGTLAGTLPGTIVPVVQFVNEISPEGTEAIELASNSAGQLHLHSDEMQINYPILSANSNEVEDGTAALANIADDLSSGAGLAHPIESLLQVSLPGTHSSVIMTEDGKVNILLDC